MNPLKFVKATAETYFAEKTTAWRSLKYFWDAVFIGFFALYLFQIYAAYIDWSQLAALAVINNWNSIDPAALWQTKLSAIYLQGIVLFGVFLKFLSAQFRGTWFLRFGELGGLIAIAAFFQHYRWTVEVRSTFFEGSACSEPGLLGMVSFNSQWLMLFFFSWVLYKFIFLIAVMWKTVRK